MSVVRSSKEEVGNMASKISGYGQVRKKLVRITAATCKKGRRCHGRKRHWNRRTSGCTGQSIFNGKRGYESKRRYDELSEKDQECNLEKIEADIEQRDYQDMHRENSPLRQAEDATLVDSSNMSIEEVVAAIKKLYEDVCNA